MKGTESGLYSQIALAAEALAGGIIALGGVVEPRTQFLLRPLVDLGLQRDERHTVMGFAVLPVLDVPGVPDGPVWAGVRPEGFVPDGTGPVACALSRVEVLGRDVSIVCTHPACQADTIRAIIPSRNLVNAADPTVRFALKPDKVFLFDQADERRLPFSLPGARR